MRSAQLAGRAVVLLVAFAGLSTVYPNRLPDGPGREIAEQTCLLCHSATLLTQQSKDSTAWAKTLAQMEKWQAPVAPGERDSLLDYLIHALGPRSQARPAVPGRASP